MLTNQEIIDILIEGENYYSSLISDNIITSRLGLPEKYISKINKLFFIITTLRYRVDRSIFDSISTKLYYKLIKLLPINI